MYKKKFLRKKHVYFHISQEDYGMIKIWLDKDFIILKR